QVQDALRVVLDPDAVRRARDAACQTLTEHVAAVAKFFEPDVRVALFEVAATERVPRHELRRSALLYGAGQAMSDLLFRRHGVVIAPGDPPPPPWRPSLTPRELYRRMLMR